MTTLVHTADVHLRPDADERFDALDAVLSLADEVGATVLTIGGDLFDRPGDVDRLRADLRNRLFADRPFEVLLVPGNHDVEAFRGDLYFGDACTVVADVEYFDTWTSPDGDLRITCLPYQSAATDDLLLALADREPFDGTEALLFHGSLDAPIDADAGDEADYRYFPVAEGTLDELGFDYYLAGHYHGAHLLKFASGAGFAYPGTPAATRTSETGRRSAVTLDPDDGLAFEPLGTAHYLDERFTVTPGDEDRVLAAIEDWVETTVTPDAIPSITVDGVVERPEAEFASQLRAVADPLWLTDETLSVDHVAANPVLDEFADRLAERDLDEETRTAVWTRTLRVAGRTLASQGRE